MHAVGESYCNDGSCAMTRRGERHLAHTGASPNTEEVFRDRTMESSVVIGLYCNDGNCARTRRGEIHGVHCDMNYIGGHKAYPSSTNTKMYFYEDRIQIGNPELIIPYSKITNIENMDEQKISALRVVGLGLVFLPLAIVGAMWKKKHLYTVIQYKDELDVHTIVIDFEGYIDEAQPLIYRKMLEFRKK